jgi:hypothetical protein
MSSEKGCQMHLTASTLATKQPHPEAHNSMSERNVLVVDDSTGGPTEMILQGTFRVDPCNFYMTADAGFDPDKNMFNTPFSKIKANCRLTPILGKPDFAFLIADYDAICENIRALQSKAPGNKNDNILSVLHRLSSVGEKGGSGTASPS